MHQKLGIWGDPSCQKRGLGAALRGGHKDVPLYCGGVTKPYQSEESLAKQWRSKRDGG